MIYGLGRRHSPDPRDRQYLMKAVLPPATADLPAYRYWWMGGSWLNQGATGMCVGYSWAHWINDGPVTHQQKASPLGIYLHATQLDEWPENDNGDQNFGTSVRAGAKAVQALGQISEYRWAWDVETVVTAILTVGPVVVGTLWYESMFTPDAKGRVHVDGRTVGGHAYVLNGVNVNREEIRFKNSWGRQWGKRGYATISFDDMDRLIKEDGEAALALEQRV